jgi:nicotinate phosphoribosyltransferase
VTDYRDIVDAFGIGGTIANAPVIDFALDIVEKNGKAKAKRGKRSGVKQVYELSSGKRTVLPVESKMPYGAIPLIEQFIKMGAITKGSDMADARFKVLTWLKSPAASEK